MKVRLVLKHIRNFIICCIKTTHELEDVVEYIEDMHEIPDSNLTHYLSHDL